MYIPLSQRLIRILTMLAIATLALILLVALASADTGAPPPPDGDPGGFASWALARIRGGEWSAVGGGALMLLALAARLGLARLDGWFLTQAGGVVTGLGVSFASILGLALAAGSPLSLELAFSALGGAAAAAGVWSWVAGMSPRLAAIARGGDK